MEGIDVGGRCVLLLCRMLVKRSRRHEQGKKVAGITDVLTPSGIRTRGSFGSSPRLQVSRFLSKRCSRYY